ncbi:class I SAM-dependent methyltransferase [Alkalicoccobacillus plakortidis]|uniref:Methyltransferase domain-containing protein n=1 Tax=Alkalicoccobacillus plakortidis TaxID=444060 RepID=A0ABT0XF68_9BACI|nr:class I SAM-dependent methyltransferase [Alkalicoccobacillus plakortidis]MCM2674542.1 methyltransferase domain-containing protein [Alkalicoccobacillus plakortidis]
MKYSYMDLLAEFGIGSAHPGGYTLTKELLTQLSIQKEDDILDCGCGTGQTASYIYTTFQCNVTAVDFHPLMIEKARNRFNMEDQMIHLVEANIESMPFSSKSFDFVLSESVAAFTHVDHTLKEYARVLKTGGKLFLNEMVLLEDPQEEEAKEIKEMYQIKQLLSTNQWVNKLNENGFQSIQLCIASPISALLNQEEDRENDFFPSEVLDPTLHDLWNEHQTLSKRYSTKLGFLLIIADKS